MITSLNHFLNKGFHSPFRFDRHRNGGGIILYVWEGIPAKLLSHISLLRKAVLSKSTCIERDGLLIVLITPTRVTLENYLISSVDQ